MADRPPFAGLKVVEFGQFIAVPYCGQLLADGGAHVVKVEPLEGDPVRHLAPLAPGESRLFACRNRGKHSLPLDLRHPASAGIIEALVAGADVVLTNLRPGLAATLGLDGPTLGARYARLIVGTVTGFGLHGPDARLPAMDLVVQARSGLMAAAGRTRDGLPVSADPPIADYTCALMLAFGIASALFRRALTGRGAQIDVSLLMAALVVQNNALVRVHTVDAPIHAAALETLTRLREGGAPFADQNAVSPQFRTPAMVSVYYRTYATKDSAIAVACVSSGLQRALMRAVGLKDEAHERPPADREAEARHYAALQARVEPVVASRTTAEWKAIFDAHGIPAAGVKIPLELLDDTQVLANGMVHDLAHPVLGPVRLVSTPVRIDGDGFTPAPATAAFGSETREILRGLGFAEAEIEGFFAAGVTRDRLP